MLVVIASFGEKNRPYLNRVIQQYRLMPFAIDIVVTSDAPKVLDAETKVVVGLPTSDPLSLPFAHKRIFAENVDRYDLFVYSEDDIGVTEANILAFLRVSADLQPDEIAGFLRYEIGLDNARSLPDAGLGWHWKPESVAQRGEYVIAEFSNEHAGFYILTQTQLRKAISSGGFLRDPYASRFGMLETAATDPYTVCGFRKCICISCLDEFLIHHMPDRYVGSMGHPLELFREQFPTLKGILAGVHPASTLLSIGSKMMYERWGKSYYEKSSDEIVSLVPADARTVLSVGCGWGATEMSLKQRGAEVTALPLDSVIGAVAALHGIAVVFGAFKECLQSLSGRKFQCVFVSNLLHLLPDPWSFLEECGELVAPGGTLILSAPNLSTLPVLSRRFLRRGEHRNIGNFEESGVRDIRMSAAARHIRSQDFRVTASHRFNRIPGLRWIKVPRVLEWLTMADWVVQGRKHQD